MTKCTLHRIEFFFGAAGLAGQHTDDAESRTEEISGWSPPGPVSKIHSYGPFFDASR